MRIGIKYRLFFTMLAATGMVVIGMLLILQWSLSRGFLDYLQRLERQRLERLATALEEIYAERGDWQILRGGRGELVEIVARRLAEEGELPERRLPPPGDHRQDRPRPGHRFERRVILLDADRRPLFGEPPGGNNELIPLRHEERTVGWLGLRPKKRPTDVNQLRFLRHQKLGMALIGGLMLVASALLALPLANRLVRPIRTLAAGTRRLAAGEYSARVPVASKDELGRLADDFNALAHALERNEGERRRWVADISHELRTPLAVLRSEIEALQDGVRPASAAALASLHGEVLQLGRLVDDLYQLSLSDLGGLQYRKESLDLAELAGQVIEVLRPRFAEKGIVLSANLPPRGTALLQGDQARLNQLLSNLLENSLRYTDAGGQLRFTLGAGKAGLLLEIEDSAPGVADADLERLFERLYRVEGSRSRATGGAGLGLSICRNIVAAHGGEITATHSPLGGLRIRVELPAEGMKGTGR